MPTNIIVFSLLLIFCLQAIQGNSRQKRQFSIGFGLPQAHGGGRQDLGGLFNNVLGGIFGQRPNQDCNNNNGGCEQGCLMRRGRRTCYCEKGFKLKNDQVTCEDLDECRIQGPRPCQETCTNTKGSFRCSCNGGRVLLPDGKSCGQALITCNQNNGGCEQVCNAQPNGVICSCGQGFELGGDGRTCVDLDECASGTANCGPGEICTNTIGGYGCAASTNQPSCAINKGGCQQRCIEEPQGLRCACRKNFILNPDSVSCSPKPTVPEQSSPCDVDNGGCQHICNFRRGQVRCSCEQGYRLRNDRIRCRFDANCNLNNGGCEQLCRVNRRGRGRCACRQGFILNEDDRTCKGEVVFDPCQINNGGCNQICTSSNGSPVCSCQTGYTLINGICQQQILTTSTVPTAITFPTQKPSSSAPTRECGVNTKKSTFRTRIVGGQPADPKDWPWMAALLRSIGGRQFCGGTLITEKHILSAAHCVYTIRPTDVKIRLGEYDFRTADENNPTDFRVDDIRVHEKYDSNTQENDIAILKLGRSSSFSEFIWPACLPPQGQNFENQRGYVTGWGTIEFGGPISSVLLEVVLPVWRQNECVQAYADNVITDTMMCAGLKAGGKDSCQGDSGGPFLLQILPSSRWYVAGIVSWGKECAKAGNPGVYTRVNKYIDWIDANSLP